MGSIEYKGKRYPTRLFIVDNPEFGEHQTIRIATDSLDVAMGGYSKHSEEETEVDDQIYFYIGDEAIELPPEEICENHLDVPMKFIEEISEEYLEK
jgi:hypothetical protein